MKRLASFFFIVILFISFFSGCAFEKERLKKKADTLQVIEIQEPPSLDSAKSHDLTSFKILKNIQEGLIRRGANNQLILGVAASFPYISKDKKTYRFLLRKAMWSDRKRITAFDFEFAWKRVLNPKTVSEYAYMLYPVKNGKAYNLGKGKQEEVGVKAIDDVTLEVKLEAPIPYFLDLVSFPTYFPQRRDIVEKYGYRYALEVDTMVYNGPFVLSEWHHGSRFQYQKNSYYWDKKAVKLQEVNNFIMKDQAMGLNLYNMGKIDYLPELGSEFINTVAEDKEKKVIKESYTTYLELNSKTLLFQNKKIRKAINLAIHRGVLTKKILKNGSIPAGGLVPPEIKGTDQKSFRHLSPVGVGYDPVKAKNLWKEGLKELGITSVKSMELVGEDTITCRRNLEFIAEELRTNLGLPTQIIALPFKQKLERGRNGQFDILLLGWDADYNDAMTFLELFTTGGAFNRGKWSNQKYDELIKKSKINPDYKERLIDLQRAEKILLDESPIIPLYYRSRIGLVRPYLKRIMWYSMGPESLKWAYIQNSMQ